MGGSGGLAEQVAQQFGDGGWVVHLGLLFTPNLAQMFDFGKAGEDILDLPDIDGQVTHIAKNKI